MEVKPPPARQKKQAAPGVEGPQRREKTKSVTHHRDAYSLLNVAIRILFRPADRLSSAGSKLQTEKTSAYRTCSESTSKLVERLVAGCTRSQTNLRKSSITTRMPYRDPEYAHAVDHPAQIAWDRLDNSTPGCSAPAPSKFVRTRRRTTTCRMRGPRPSRKGLERDTSVSSTEVKRRNKFSEKFLRSMDLYLKLYWPLQRGV